MDTLDSRTRASLLVAARDPANKEAREAFAQRYAGLIRDWCRRWGLQKADQDDLSQTILCRLFEKLPTLQYDRNKRFRGLVHDMVDYAIADHYRARQRRPGGYGSGDTGILGKLHDTPAPEEGSVEDLIHVITGHLERDQQLNAACQRVRERVEPRTWQVFWLTEVEERPAAEVAHQLGIKIAAVHVYRWRVREMIKKAIGST